MTDRELMQWALDALTQANQCIFISAKLPFPPALNATSKAAEALRARLAEPEPEVRWDASAPLVVHPHPAFQATQPQPPEAEVCCQDFEKCVRSCTPRGQWIAHVRCGCGDQIMPDDGAECGNCVTARNAVKPQPVAQVHVAEDYYPHVIWAEGINAACFDQEYLYITPPQREWQGLTENEIKHLWYEACQTNLELTSQLIVHLARNIEAKLKEQNT